jgi:hypothetical protein
MIDEITSVDGINFVRNGYLISKDKVSEEEKKPWKYHDAIIFVMDKDHVDILA